MCRIIKSIAPNVNVNTPKNKLCDRGIYFIQKSLYFMEYDLKNLTGNLIRNNFES